MSTLMELYRQRQAASGAEHTADAAATWAEYRELLLQLDQPAGKDAERVLSRLDAVAEQLGVSAAEVELHQVAVREASALEAELAMLPALRERASESDEGRKAAHAAYVTAHEAFAEANAKHEATMREIGRCKGYEEQLAILRRALPGPVAGLDADPDLTQGFGVGNVAQKARMLGITPKRPRGPHDLRPVVRETDRDRQDGADRRGVGGVARRAGAIR